jgi:hypothetical protein
MVITRRVRGVFDDAPTRITGVWPLTTITDT